MKAPRRQPEEIRPARLSKPSAGETTENANQPTEMSPPMDVEAPILRESWSALEHLLASAEVPIDPHALEARVRARLSARRWSRSRRFAGWGLLATSVAAAVLVAIYVPAPTLETGDRVATNEPTTAPAKPTEPGFYNRPSLPAAELAWDDGADAKLEALAIELADACRNAPEPPDASAILQREVDELADELARDRL